MKKLELYLHIPFCISKCKYCDFLSAPAKADVAEAYVKQLQREIAVSGAFYHAYEIVTVFFGGGTPSILTVQQMEDLLTDVHRFFHVHPKAEITIECNPGTLNQDKLRCYVKLGVNRLSIGLQSANLEEQRLLGRIHTYEQFLMNYDLARETGFCNINVDIISGLPGQTASTYEATVQKVLAVKPEHISAYSLIIEKGTPFYETYGQAAKLREQGMAQQLLPTEEEDRRMYAMTKQMLHDAGYDRYEISNYSYPGYACRHNIGYWTRENYLGMGLGAASMIENVRFCNPADLTDYLALNFACQKTGPSWQENQESLTQQAQMEEFMFLGLRMMCGVSAAAFREQFAKEITDVYGNVLKEQLCQKLIKQTAEGYSLTEYGIDVSNYVMSAYLLD